MRKRFLDGFFIAPQSSLMRSSIKWDVDSGSGDRTMLTGFTASRITRLTPLDLPPQLRSTRSHNTHTRSCTSAWQEVPVRNHRTQQVNESTPQSLTPVQLTSSNPLTRMKPTTATQLVVVLPQNTMFDQKTSTWEPFWRTQNFRGA